MKVAASIDSTIAAFVITLFLFSCNGYQDKPKFLAPVHISVDITQASHHVSNPAFDNIEKKLRENGLSDIQEIDSTIAVDLKYAGHDNIFGRNVYGNLRRAFLQPDVAVKLAKAQEYLKKLHPDYSLVIYDAARPLSLQQILWDSLKMPGREKGKYVANPRNGGSLHNYGAAIDVSIIDAAGKELDMGCPFDFFGEQASPMNESKLLASGKLNNLKIANRKLLRKVMYHAGFFNIQTEWWHFNACSREKAMRTYMIIE